MFACARGQAKAFFAPTWGEEENVYMIGVMSFNFYHRSEELIALPVHAPHHWFKVFPGLSLCCSPFSLGALVDFPLRPGIPISRTGGGHNILVLYLFAS